MKSRALVPFLALSLSLGDILDAQGVAQNPPPTPVVAPGVAEPGSNLTVYLLTFGMGDVVWERFGHNAIRIKDAARGTDLTYNWGMFDFNQPRFIQRFLTGDTRYWMEAAQAAAVRRAERAA